MLYLSLGIKVSNSSVTTGFDGRMFRTKNVEIFFQLIEKSIRKNFDQSSIHVFLSHHILLSIHSVWNKCIHMILRLKDWVMKYNVYCDWVMKYVYCEYHIVFECSMNIQRKRISYEKSLVGLVNTYLLNLAVPCIGFFLPYDFRRLNIGPYDLLNSINRFVVQEIVPV